MIINYNHICSFIVLATVIAIVNCDCKTFIVQASGDVIPIETALATRPITKKSKFLNGVDFNLISYSIANRLQAGI